MSGLVQEDVFRLQISKNQRRKERNVPINNHVLVQLENGQHDFCDIESNEILIQHFLLVEVEEQIPTITELGDDAQAVLDVIEVAGEENRRQAEQILEFHNEWRFNSMEHADFIVGVGDLVVLDDVLFLEHLEASSGRN